MTDLEEKLSIARYDVRQAEVDLERARVRGDWDDLPEARKELDAARARLAALGRS
jgi:hypothetical protein